MPSGTSDVKNNSKTETSQIFSQVLDKSSANESHSMIEIVQSLPVTVEMESEDETDSKDHTESRNPATEIVLSQPVTVEIESEDETDSKDHTESRNPATEIVLSQPVTVEMESEDETDSKDHTESRNPATEIVLSQPVTVEMESEDETDSKDHTESRNPTTEIMQSSGDLLPDNTENSEVLGNFLITNYFQPTSSGNSQETEDPEISLSSPSVTCLKTELVRSDDDSASERSERDKVIGDDFVAIREKEPSVQGDSASLLE